MIPHILSNPKNFCQEARRFEVTYEYLLESIECHGKQRTAEYFEGKSLRGKGTSLSSASVDTWMATLKFIKDNPDHVDKDPYQARVIEPKRGMVRIRKGD